MRTLALDRWQRCLTARPHVSKIQFHFLKVRMVASLPPLILEGKRKYPVTHLLRDEGRILNNVNSICPQSPMLFFFSFFWFVFLQV